MVFLQVITIAIHITGVAVEAVAVAMEEEEEAMLPIAPLLTMAQAVGTIIHITEAARETTMGAEEPTITHIDPHLHRHDLDTQVQHLQDLLDLLADRLLPDTLLHTMDRRLHISHPRLTTSFAFLMRTLLHHQLEDLSLPKCRLQWLQDSRLRDQEETHLQGRLQYQQHRHQRQQQLQQHHHQ